MAATRKLEKPKIAELSEMPKTLKQVNTITNLPFGTELCFSQDSRYLLIDISYCILFSWDSIQDNKFLPL